MSMAPYAVRDGKVVSNGCEIGIVEHCNLACRACSHLAPALPRWLADPETVRRDLSVLARVYEPRLVRLIGGEPLLHPRLEAIIAAVRGSGIAQYISVTTNGVLLPKMSLRFWELVNAIHVSSYPGYQLSAQQMIECSRLAREHRVSLSFGYIGQFREQVAARGTPDRRLVRRIYATCDVAHTWRCHSIAEGYFYKCPQSRFIPKVLDGDPAAVQRDALPIVDEPGFGEKLLAFLQSPEPLEACRRCLGTVGRLFPHEQRDRRRWAADLQHTTEDLLDVEELALREAGARGRGRSGTPQRRLTTGVTPAVPIAVR